MLRSLLSAPLRTARRLAGAGPADDGRDLKVVIIGSGFSGIAMALAMKAAGRAHEMLIVEAADEIGGTWRDNTYPGCACDVPSPVYSLRGHAHPWSQFFAPQPEIQAHLHRVVEAEGLRQHLRLSTRIATQVWDEGTATWLLTTEDGDLILADVVINAVGPLTKPVIPDIPGIADFEGPAFHTARWRHDVDLTGLRVGVVGTGASAVQVIPSIVDQVDHLAVFQRTPAWVLPKPDRHFSTVEQAAMRIPGVHQVVRQITHQLLERRVWRMIEQDPDTIRRLRSAGRWNINRGVTDPDLRAALTPDFDPGCKRLLVSNTYYPALARDHVDVHTTGITRATSDGIALSDGQHVELDVLIWGTGFDPLHFWAPMEVVGRDGLRLDDAWASRPQTYNSLAAPGFPNAFFLLGPNSGTGHNSVVMVAEAQADHVIQALDVLRHVDVLAARPEAAEAYAADLEDRHADLVWASGCGSWYLDDAGRNHALYPGNITDYQRRVRTFDRSAWQTRSRSGREGDRPLVEGQPTPVV